MAKNLKSVEGLDLRRCGLLTDGGLASLAGLGSLRILNLDHCALITDKVGGPSSHITCIASLTAAHYLLFDNYGMPSHSSLSLFLEPSCRPLG